MKDSSTYNDNLSLGKYGRMRRTYLQEHRNIFHFLREGDAVSAYQEMLRHLSIPLTIIDSKE